MKKRPMSVCTVAYLLDREGRKRCRMGWRRLRLAAEARLRIKGSTFTSQTFAVVRST